MENIDREETIKILRLIAAGDLLPGLLPGDAIVHRYVIAGKPGNYTINGKPATDSEVNTIISRTDGINHRRAACKLPLDKLVFA